MSLIPVRLISRNESQFEPSNISFHESKVNGVGLNSNRLDYGIRKNRSIKMRKSDGFLHTVQFERVQSRNDNFEIGKFSILNKHLPLIDTLGDEIW